MPRISTYDFDGTLSNTDKIIGTDSSDTTTKNFKLQDLKEFIFSGISGPITINSSGVSSVTFPDVTLGTNTSGSYVESLVAGDGIQLLNNSGEGATPTIKVNPLQTTITSILNTGLCVGRDSDNKICFTTDNQIRFTVNNALDLILSENSLTPGTSNGTALGTSSLMWSDLFLASESVVNFNNGNVTVTHGDGVLQIDTDSKLEFGDTGTFIHQSANGILDLVSDDELELNATNEVEINTTLVDVNASGAITLNAEANSNITITGELDIDSSSALTVDSATSISIGTHQDKPIDIDASTLQIDASGGFSIDSGAVSSNITVTTGGGDAKDLTVSVDGGGDSSLILSSSGTAADALKIVTTAGGIDITNGGASGEDIDISGVLSAVNITSSESTSDSIKIESTAGGIDILASGAAAGEDIDITATGSSVNISSTENSANAIKLHANGGTSETIKIHADQGTAGNSVELLSDAGGIAMGAGTTFDLDATGAATIDSDGIDINSGSGTIELTTTGSLDVNSSAATIDTTTLSIDSTDTTNITMTANSSSAKTLTIDALNSGSGAGSILLGVTSGTAVTIGHTTSQTTVSDNLTVTGKLNVDDVTDATDATNGALVVDGGISVAKKIFCTSTVTASNFITTSDRRLKSEIEPIKEGIEVIKQFTSYNYVKGGEKESGFIAQEVKEVIPHAVYENNEGYLSMSDRSIVAHMHKAILELEKRLTSIEEKFK
tara:strand:- start:481 stop:2655 length:2175 start_codon:yes stop_codon:yes gene_type:complete